MSEDQKKQLNQQLWNIANTLRGKMDADEFRDYILGFIFYKYLSEKMEIYANVILKEDKLKYLDISEDTAEGKEYLEAVREEALEKLGYFLKPSELFGQVAKRGNGNGKSESNFIIEDIQKILNNIQLSTMGTRSEEDFDHLFEDLDLNSTKLGKTPEQRNEVIAKVLSHLDKIDFKLEQSEIDVLGDAYEYLIGEFASGAGKKAGEFYTPQQASKILARIVTLGKTRIKSAYDPTVGSGSLILRLGKHCEVLNFYGQERNRTTYNLCRMNMILHGVHFTRFDIKLEDTLEYPQHSKLEAEAVVANPPFSAQWSANQLFLTDDRFSEYGKLAPSSKADFAFIQHMIYNLAENGVMAVIMPHGVLFRGGAEGHIRKYLIEEKNYLDAVIGLPANIFYGTSIPTCIMVFKKCREQPDNILFIDASQHFEKVKTQNYLRDSDVDKIIDTYRQRINIEEYSYIASLDEVRENDYKLNILRYGDTLEKEIPIDINSVCKLLDVIKQQSIRNDETLKNICEEIGFPFPNWNNASLLLQYKKGVIQKIFSQAVRFKQENGMDFPMWEKKKLGELTYKTGKKNKDNIKYPIYSINNKEGFLPQSDQFDGMDSNSRGYDISLYKIIEKNTFAYNPARINVGSIGHSGELENVIISSLYVCFKTTDELEDSFLLQFLKTNEFNKSVLKNVEGGVRDYLFYENFSNIKIQLPSNKEQIRIANFLSAIDRKIEYCQMQYEKAESWHKGLL